MSKTSILSNLQVEQIIQRIAHQILEDNYDEQEIILVGVANRGYTIAQRIQSILKNITDSEVNLFSLQLDKDDPLNNHIDFQGNLSDLNGKSVILIDDVLNSGKTLIYAVKYLLKADLKRLSTAVLVDRRHRRYPIKADYAGLTLSTTLKEHIAVKFENEKVEVFLD